MECEKCKEYIDDYADHVVKVNSSGSGYNYTFAQKEHWWDVDVKCPECGHIFTVSDSSL